MKRVPLALVSIASIAAMGLPVSPATAQQTDPTSASESASHDAFRVLPYLQKPAHDEMTINWITETSEPGTLTVTGPGLTGKITLTSQPEYQPLLDYSDAELTQNIAGLEQGSWLKGDTNYKHSVTLEGLRADSSYRYTVTQAGTKYAARFSTPPTSEWKDVRIIAFSDSETEPKGRIEQREWEINPISGYADGSVERPGPGSLWADKHGSATRYGEFTLRYPMTQDRAIKENIGWIDQADPDLLLIAGDLVQGGGYQPGWDEFFGYVAGEHGQLASRTPLITALGNWETFASVSGGYGTSQDRSAVVRSRNKYHAYFDTFSDAANPQFKDSYHRIDHGPVTVITLDSTNGVPDENTGTGTLSNPVFSGDDTNLTFDTLSTDTQGSFTADEYATAYPKVFPGTSPDGADLPAFNPGSEQWQWAETQLAEARAEGQIIVVQFHHAAYSNGVHGTPPNHVFDDNQSGVAMRAYTPMFEKYGVAAVLSGHDEMFERSWIDTDDDGIGFHSYDIGVAADGLRGEQLFQQEDGSYAPIRFNTHSEWMAATEEPELWVEDDNGRPQLVDGGLHYGHLQIDVANTRCGAEMTMTPVYLFPVMNSDYDVETTERRIYDDIVTINLDDDGTVLAEPCTTRPPGAGVAADHGPRR